MKTLPCIDCIVFPICKSKADDRNKNSYVFPLIPVIQKCSLLRVYINENIKELHFYIPTETHG